MFTRSPLIVRDIPILQELAAVNAIRVLVSIPISDPEICQALEPGTVRPHHRFRTIQLSAAGIPVGISIAPLIPGLTDSDIPRLQQAKIAGAQYAMMQAPPFAWHGGRCFQFGCARRCPCVQIRSSTVLRNAQRQAQQCGLGSVPKGQGIRWQMSVPLFRLWKTKWVLSRCPLQQAQSLSSARGRRLRCFRSIFQRADIVSVDVHVHGVPKCSIVLRISSCY